MINLELIKLFKSLGWGGLLGAGLLGIIYLLWPVVFPASLSIDTVLIVGGLFGAGLHGLFSDLARLIAQTRRESKKQEQLTERLLILQEAERFGFISPENAQQIREKLLIDFLVPGNSNDPSLSLPSSEQQRQLEGSNDDELDEDKDSNS